MGVQRGVLGRQEGGTLGGQDRRGGQVVVAEGKKNGALYFTPIFYTHHTITMSNNTILLSLLDIFIRLFIK